MAYEYTAFFELSRSEKSRAQLKEADKAFKKNPIFSKVYIGLEGRRFWFQFTSAQERDQVMANLGKLMAEKGRKTETIK